MSTTEEKPPPAGFEAAVRPLMEWLATQGPPDSGVIVTSTHAELLSSLSTFQTKDYAKKVKP